MTQPLIVGKSGFRTNEGLVAPFTRRRAAVELLWLIGAVEWCLWTDSRHVFPKSVRLLNTVVVALIVLAIVIRQRPSLRDLGFAPPSWFAGLKSLALFTLIGMGLLFGTGFYLGSLGNEQAWATWVRKNWHMEGLQQLLLQVLLVPRLAVLLGGNGTKVSLIAAILFSLLHAPNVLLMGLTMIAGFVWCEWYRRFPNLPALWISHLSLASAALLSINGSALGMLRVGIGYVFRNY
ncbi:MAG: hypothetical protein U1D30_15855 [Planctomycetota bacterium]